VPEFPSAGLADNSMEYLNDFISGWALGKIGEYSLGDVYQENKNTLAKDFKKLVEPKCTDLKTQLSHRRIATASKLF